MALNPAHGARNSKTWTGRSARLRSIASAGSFTLRCQVLARTIPTQGDSNGSYSQKDRGRVSRDGLLALTIRLDTRTLKPKRAVARRRATAKKHAHVLSVPRCTAPLDRAFALLIVPTALQAQVLPSVGCPKAHCDQANSGFINLPIPPGSQSSPPIILWTRCNTLVGGGDRLMASVSDARRTAALRKCARSAVRASTLAMTTTSSPTDLLLTAGQHQCQPERHSGDPDQRASAFTSSGDDPRQRLRRRHYLRSTATEGSSFP